MAYGDQEKSLLGDENVFYDSQKIVGVSILDGKDTIGSSDRILAFSGEFDAESLDERIARMDVYPRKRQGWISFVRRDKQPRILLPSGRHVSTDSQYFLDVNSTYAVESEHSPQEYERAHAEFRELKSQVKDYLGGQSGWRSLPTAIIDTKRNSRSSSR